MEDRLGILITALLSAVTIIFAFHHWLGLTAWFTAMTVSSALSTIIHAIKDRK